MLGIEGYRCKDCGEFSLVKEKRLNCNYWGGRAGHSWIDAEEFTKSQMDIEEIEEFGEEES